MRIREPDCRSLAILKVQGSGSLLKGVVLRNKVGPGVVVIVATLLEDKEGTLSCCLDF